MANYRYKNFAEGYIYHIYNRGNNKQNIFLDEDDYKFFILRLKQNLGLEEKKPRLMRMMPSNSFFVLSYSLLPNHFHFIIKQNKNIPTSYLMTKLCTSYSMYFNKKYETVGHVFQGRFKQKTIEKDSYLLWLSAYIHQNPRLHKITENIIEYNWSSYKEYQWKNNPDNICQTNFILEMFKDVEEYRNFVENNYNVLEKNKKIKKFCDE
ncbi:MAG: transposase [Parcubacteria group bacterium CG10_big_fil_rev_8_21_14_0_10_36_14]|nr:MAG: transposase [Parcubacteria group bacterium CG10_big_fil_rev_8_21_14_0_10_36_14]